MGRRCFCKFRNFITIFDFLFIILFHTGLHFFHLLLGLFLLGLFFWGCSFPSKKIYFVSLRVSEVHLFYNLQLFYWHFLEILWLFIFLVFYRSYQTNKRSVNGFWILLSCPNFPC